VTCANPLVDCCFLGFTPRAGPSSATCPRRITALPPGLLPNGLQIMADLRALAPWLTSSRSRTDEVIWTQLPGTARPSHPQLFGREAGALRLAAELFNGVVTLGESHQRWGSHRSRAGWPASGQSVRPSAPHSNGFALPGNCACARLTGRTVWEGPLRRVDPAPGETRAARCRVVAWCWSACGLPARPARRGLDAAEERVQAGGEPLVTVVCPDVLA